MPERPNWTLTEATEHTGTSRSTLRRRLEAGAFPNATQNSTGIWRIPLTDLLAAGISPKKTWLTDTLTERAHPKTELGHERAQTLQTRINTLEQELASERAQIQIERAHRQAAEHIAQAERQRADTATMALRILEGSNQAAATDPVKKPRQRWFKALRDDT